MILIKPSLQTIKYNKTKKKLKIHQLKVKIQAYLLLTNHL